MSQPQAQREQGQERRPPAARRDDPEPDDDGAGATSAAYDWRLLRRLLGYLRPYLPQMAASFALIVVMAGLDLVGPYLFKVAIDRHIAVGDARGLRDVALLYLLTLLAGYCVRFGQVYILQLTGQRIIYDLRRQIFAHLQSLHVAYFDRTPLGKLITRVTSDVDALNELFTSGVVTVFGDVLTLLGIMGVMLALDWRLALVTFAVLPCFVLVTDWFRRGAREGFRGVRKWVAQMNAFLQESLTGMAVLQLFSREARARADFAERNAAHRDAHMRTIFYYAVFYPAIDILAALAAALILLYGGSRVLSAGLTLGALVAFVQYSERFWRPISDLSEKFNLLQAAMASSERIFELLDTRPEVVAPAAPVRLERVQGRVAFENVSFAYQPGEPVLRDVSFTVEPGRSLALVGATGAGKSTVIGLLTRFYDVTAGRVTLDGVDVRELDPAQLRGALALVLQDVHLFGGSVRSNVALGSPIPDEMLREAARAVHAERFIEGLPQGWDTEVLERGASLSVGQKQLLSFARALAHDPRILVLDEATSSIDTATEQLIQSALRALLRGRTAIVIAHRLSTIQDVDEILVMHKGRVRERGRHQELLAQRGLYWRLYQLQYKDQERREPTPVEARP
jgi:ATP-binding cassette subfamily B protein